jgi:serine/threonine protein phosphatase PrpC
MNCDSYFEIGSSHLVCQDYALSGFYKDMCYGIVSDGCSSAENSEIGAQVLCHATKYFLALYYDLFFNNSMTPESLVELLGNSIRTRADEIRKIYPISRDSLQATLLIAAMLNGNAFIFAWGDGVIIKSISEYSKNVDEIDYPLTNAPVYLMTDVNAYNEKFAGQLEKRVQRYQFTSSLDTSPDNSDKFIVVNQKKEIFRPYQSPSLYVFSIKPRDCITIATDGLVQYQDQDKNPVKTELIIPQILDYPNCNGQFVKRTMNFMKRDLVKKGWSHSDDIGIATLIN